MDHIGVEVVTIRTSVRMLEMYQSDVVPDDVTNKPEGGFLAGKR